ncbi:prolipoprotein diacylglyceryl transferase [Leeia aquatica]|uniref:Phosphatidylglycerol--prolipoprotein diacylglyceryl transferase n=1 Tax=Leeia aquatica TaxID=2725557 RepID=A0A847SGF7_9NEIS|nr:prolipoprotein diacylglyceryl transferase [Leeia aquatica]NLR76338.1 prolipoprotein diacylglyceryl transferase [Leeia aquatica]
MLNHADLGFQPIAFQVGPLAVHWYGLMYFTAFLLFLGLGRLRLRQMKHLELTSRDLDDLLFYGALGVILGGRLGYVLFYKFSDYLTQPLNIFKVWEGGMSFHGGMLGVFLATLLFARKKKLTWLTVTDFIAPTVPMGLMVGRFGNFINGELWGRVASAELPWAMLFPGARSDDASYLMAHPEWNTFFAQYGSLPRHPSQLYEMALEGLLLFILLWLYARKARPTGAVSALFMIGYGSFRFIAEFAREPDNFLGLLRFSLSMGQWLSLPMVLIGLWMWWASHNQKPGRRMVR